MCYNAEGKMDKRGWLKKKFIPLSALLLVIAITVGIFLFYRQSPNMVEKLEGYGYFGAFLISLIGNASILLPGIVLPLLTGLGIVFYPASGIVGLVMLGLAGGVGAAIGELSGYVVGYSGRGVVENKKLYWRLVGWVKRWGALAIFIFALVPLFFDLVGLAAGVLRFPVWKFFLVCWLGRTILYVAFIVLAALGWKTVLPYLN